MLQNEKSFNMAEDTERSIMNYQKGRDQHIRLKEIVSKNKMDVEMESKNRYETKKQHAERS